jgi:hypothetical protein
VPAHAIPQYLTNQTHSQNAGALQAEGLMQLELDVAQGSADTQLPAGLERPASWAAAAPPASPGPSPMTG